MVRTFVRKTGDPKYGIADIVRAIKQVRISAISIRKAAKDHNMPEATLRVYLKKLDGLLVDVAATTDDDLWVAVDSCKSRQTVCEKCIV